MNIDFKGKTPEYLVRIQPVDAIVVVVKDNRNGNGGLALKHSVQLERIERDINKLKETIKG